MPHNIESYRDSQKRTKNFDPGVTGGTILTLVDTMVSGDRMTALYFRDDAVVINPWKDHPGDVVEVKGEDLFALRELLNELPEKAFVRPADPVEESYVVKDRDGDWWALNARGYWESVCIGGRHFEFNNFSGAWRGVDSFPDNELEKPALPRWTDGDIVRPDHPKAGVTYIRRSGGWDRHTAIGGSGGITYLDQTDERISGLVDGAGYVVVFQATASTN